MAQKEKSIIRSLIDPTIELEELSVADVEEGTNPNSGKRGTKVQKQMGNNFPFVKINTYILNQEELIKLKIDCTGFIPEITLQFVLSGPSTFLSRDFPKDGDIVNVFIRGRNDLFKPIRNDYIITNVSTSKSGNAQGGGMVINIAGYLDIPDIWNEVTLSKNGNSYEVLQELAQDLGLGFATNETSTSDSQNWLCVRDSYHNFIKEITGCAWKNDNSFFSSYIDVYYHLNFVNVNNQFSDSSEIDEALLDVLISNDGLEGDEIAQVNVKKVFTNIEDHRNTNMFIQSYKLVNRASEIATRYGYKMYAEFFEQNTLQKWEIFAEPLVVEGSANEKILLKGKPGDDSYKNTMKKRWLGVQYTLPEHNVHEKYLFSMVHNLINNKELEKLQVHIDVPRANFNIYRGERIPCVFVSSGEPMKTPFLQQPGETEGENSQVLKEPGAPVLDKFYSGYYMIHGMVFSYSAVDNNSGEFGQFTETVMLSRREWPTP